MICNNQQYDLIIKRGDTKPPVVYVMPDCDDIDLSDEAIQITVSMWSKANLSSKISSLDTNIKFKNNYNITSVSLDNYILLKKYNSFEYIKVIEVNHDSIIVTRAELSSDSRDWEKGSDLKIIKLLDVEGDKEILYNDIIDLNGQTQKMVSARRLIYNWVEGDTVKPGDYFMEFKVSKFDGPSLLWSRKFPLVEEGIKIQITDDNLEI